MSKIGKKNIIVPKESSIKIEGSNLTITGPKGTKKLTIKIVNCHKNSFVISYSKAILTVGLVY